MATKKGTILNDTINGTGGNDHLFGDLGNDVLAGLAGDDQLIGGEGNDLANGGDGNDHLLGGLGLDVLNGGNGDDHLDGGNGFNVFAGDTVKDILNGGAGNDEANMGLNDIFNGGAGFDNAFLNIFPKVPSLIKVNASQISGNAPVALGGGILVKTLLGSTESLDLFIGNALPGSSIIGSPGDDSLSLNTVFNGPPGTQGISISGGGGNDRVTGSFKSDVLNGGTGQDTVDCGSGGTDSCTGGLDDDFFLFRISQANNIVPGVITDFLPGHDFWTVAVDPNSGINFGNQQNFFVTVANPTNGTTPAGIAQFLYNQNNGQLFIDSNGLTPGGLTLFETFSNKPHLSGSDGAVEYNIFP